MPQAQHTPPVLTVGSVPLENTVDRSPAGLQYQRFQLGLRQTGEGSLGMGLHPGPVVDAQFRSPPQPRNLSGSQFGASSNSREVMSENNNAY